MKAWVARRTNALRRIFSLWVLLALFLCTGIGLVAVNAVLMFGLIRSHISEVCSAARGAYEDGGVESLRLVLRGAEIGPGMRVHLLDSAGVDLVTGQDLPARTSGGQPDALSARASHPEVIVKNGAYSCVAEPPARPSAIPLGPMLWVLPFVSALCCTVGAYVTWRLRKIETVVNYFGSGELAARMNADSGDSIGRLARAFNQMAERIESLVASHQPAPGLISAQKDGIPRQARTLICGGSPQSGELWRIVTRRTPDTEARRQIDFRTRSELTYRVFNSRSCFGWWSLQLGGNPRWYSDRLRLWLCCSAVWPPPSHKKQRL